MSEPGTITLTEEQYQWLLALEDWRQVAWHPALVALWFSLHPPKNS